MNRALVYFLRRLLVLAVGILVILTAEFMILRVLPGDPMLLALPRSPGMYLNPELMSEYLEKFEQPLFLQYFDFLGDMLAGDFWYSYVYGVDVKVSSFIYDYTGRTLILFLSSVAVSMLVGVFWGRLISGARDHPVRQIMSFIPLGLMSAAVISWTWTMISVLANGSAGFPRGGVLPIGFSSDNALEVFWAYLTHAALPVICLSLSMVGLFTLVSRDGHIMWAALSRDHSSGRPRTADALFIALPNLQLVIAGSMCFVIVVEVFFNYAGLGWLLMQSLYRADYPVVQATFFLIAVIVFLSNFLVDIVVTLARPGWKLDDPVGPEPAPAERADVVTFQAPTEPAVRQGARTRDAVLVVAEEYFKSPVGLVALAVFLGFVGIAVIGPLVVSDELVTPYIRTPSYLFLTGATGPLVVSLIVGVISLLVGVVAGVFAGVVRPYLDALLTAVTRGLIALPAVVLVALVSYATYSSLGSSDAGYYAHAARMAIVFAAPIALLVHHRYGVVASGRRPGSSEVQPLKGVLPWAVMGLKYGMVLAMLTVFIGDFLNLTPWDSWGAGVELAFCFTMLHTGGWDYVLPLFAGMFLLTASTYLVLDTLERIVRTRSSDSA